MSRGRQRPERVLVTGASRGIGRAVAERLLAEGTRVALVGRDAAALEVVRAGRDHAAIVEADLGVPGAGASVVERAVQALGFVDGLVGCAGAIQYAPVGQIDEASLRAQLELDFVQPLLLSQALASHMRGAGRPGALVQVASNLVMQPAPHTAAYAAAKAALVAMVRSFALELAPAGIRVNAVAPGVVDTAMVRVPRGPVGEGASPPQLVEQQLATLARLHPLGRLGTPGELVESILLGLEAPWMTGSVITHDGGFLLGSAPL